jgi:predicted enzyme related to lactoylglutathione lyase
MHKSRLGVVVIDCKTDDLANAARFWEAALGRPVTIDPDGKYAQLADDGGDIRVLLQAVDHDSRVHLDIETYDIEAEVRRLAAAGAREIARIKGWVVMEAPTGHRFCVVKPQTRAFAETARVWA